MAGEHDAAMGELDNILSNLSTADGPPSGRGARSASMVVRAVAEKEHLDESRIKQVLDTLEREEIRTEQDLRLLPRTAWASLGVPLGLAYKVQHELGVGSGDGDGVGTPPAMSLLSTAAPSTFLLMSVGAAPAPAPAYTPAPASVKGQPSSPPPAPAAAAAAAAATTPAPAAVSPRPAAAKGAWAGAKPSLATHDAGDARRVSPMPSPRPAPPSPRPAPAPAPLAASASKELAPALQQAKAAPAPLALSTSKEEVRGAAAGGEAEARRVVEALMAHVELRAAPPPGHVSAAQVAALFDGFLLAYPAYALLAEQATARRWVLTRVGINKELSPAGGELLRVHVPSTQTLFLVLISPNAPHLAYPPLAPLSPRSASPSAPSLPALALPAAAAAPSGAASPRGPSPSAPLSPRDAAGALVSPRGEGAHTLYKRRLLQSRLWTDVTLTLGAVKFALHSFVLLARGEGLLSAKDRAALERRRKRHEGGAHHIEFSARELAGLPPATLELLVDFVYTGDTAPLPRLPVRELVALAAAARRFHFERLHHAAERTLRQVLSVDNVHAAMRLAAELGEAELVRVCMLYALCHYTAFVGNKAGNALIGIDLYSEVVRQAAAHSPAHAEAQLAAARPAPANEYAAQWAGVLDDAATHGDGVARFVWGTDSHQRPLLLGDRVRFHKAVLAALSEALAGYVREAPGEEVLFFVTPDSFRALLRYAYTGAAAFTVQHAADLFPFAQRTHATDLFRLLDDRVRDPAELTVHNVLYILSVTYLPYMRDRADVQRTRGAALAFLLANLAHVELAPLRHLPPATAIELLFAVQADATRAAS